MFRKNRLGKSDDIVKLDVEKEFRKDVIYLLDDIQKKLRHIEERFEKQDKDELIKLTEDLRTWRT